MIQEVPRLYLQGLVWRFEERRTCSEGWRTFAGDRPAWARFG